MIRRFLAFLLLAAAVTATVPAQAQEQVWRLARGYPDSNFHTDNLRIFASEIDAITGGKVGISIHGNGALLRVPAIKQAVREGRVEMGEFVLSIHDDESALFGVDNVPFLAGSYADASALWEASRAAIARKLDDQGLVLLMAVPWPPNGLYSKFPIATLDDIRGRTLRTYTTTTRRLADVLGAKPVEISTAEGAQRFAEGATDMFIASTSSGLSAQAWTHYRYYYDLKIFIAKNYVVVNKGLFLALDKTRQAAILNAARHAERRGWEASQEPESSDLLDLSRHGITIERGSLALRAELYRIGQQLSEEWVATAGPEGKAILETYQLNVR